MSRSLEITAQGECLLGGRPLHPGQGALAAARRDLAPLLAQAQSGDLVLLAGLGLGWHARAAVEHGPAPNLLVFEPDARRRALAACLGPVWLNGASTVLARDTNELTEALAARLVYGQGGRVCFYCHAAYRQAEPELMATVQEVLQRCQLRAQVEKANRHAKHRQWLEHLAENFKLVLDLPDVSRLAGLCPGQPALVVGAGPSLDQSLPQLRGIAERCLVLAAASALGPLARVGVAPHLALAMEAKDESRQFAGADPARTILAAASSSHPNHFAAWPGQKALFHLQAWVAKLIGAGVSLPSGGHVSSVAFSLAILFGCDPVILVGQDLAFSNGRQHASGRPGGEDDARPQTVSVPAIGGGQVETSLVMQSYISWYQESAAYLARRHPGRRIINASAQGALLPGFTHLPLTEALAGLSTYINYFSDMRAALAAQAHLRPSDLSLALGQARADLRRALALLAQQGLSACRAALAPASPAAAALQDLPNHAEPEEASQALLFMSDMLRTMSEALYV